MKGGKACYARGGSQLIWVFGIAWHRMVLHGIVRRGAMPGRACWGGSQLIWGVTSLPLRQTDHTHLTHTKTPKEKYMRSGEKKNSLHLKTLLKYSQINARQ